jgi:protein-S-isoprenylcysteine O-methyltransferase Ste14
MAHFSWLCLAAVVLGTVIFISKSRLEEKFLAHDEEYQAYLARVKWRFVPLVV